MAIERCSLCGGRPGQQWNLVQECGMDNTKNDKKYSLNKNLKLDFRQAEPSGKNTENSRGAAEEDRAGTSRTYEQKPFEEQRRRPHTPPPYQGSAGRTYRGRRSEGNSGDRGKGCLCGCPADYHRSGGSGIYAGPRRRGRLL